jgi:hypothetical protein
MRRGKCSPLTGLSTLHARADSAATDLFIVIQPIYLYSAESYDG